jgi:predicted acyl esterase
MGGQSKILATVGLTLALAVVPVVAASPAGAATFSANGSVEQVYVTHAPPGSAVDLRDAANHVVAHGAVDDLGSFLFREVVPGDGYTVIDGGQSSAPLHVMTRTETPPQSFYTNQHLADGFGYITTRDGTKLSAEITLPGPADHGPYPTVIEYSGYDPSHPGHPQPSTLISQLLGYATVGVNVRGTGCSGGAFQFFEPLSALDGYDVVEAVAAQPWVAHGKPGMVGISYPGIAQTFVAPTRPPHLAAIAPLSVMADAYRSLSYPGGIPNIGFPHEWSQERDDNARPYGQGWEQSVVDAGGPNGAQCAENQLLRHENTSLVNTFDTHPYREPVGGADTLSPGADSLSPQLLDANINVPVFMGGAWQDEQTGGQSSLIWEHLGGLASQHKLFATNGTHVDSLVAELNRWYEFLEFYVARRIPKVPAGVRAIAPIIFEQATGISGVQLEPDRFTQYPTYAAALAAYESEPPIRVLFENGTGDKSNLGAPFGTYEMHFTSWPPPNVQPTSWFFQPDQMLGASAPSIADADGRAATSYQYDPTAKPATDFHGSTGDIWAAHPAFDWRVLPLGKALALDSPPLTSTTVTAGPGSVDLWLKSTAPDTDLEVTLTELRPDGQEVYVQNGWLRASHRALDATHSTPLEPVHPDTSASAAPLPANTFVSARVALFPFAHIFRAGSRIRITVEAPGGNRPFWAFGDLPANGTVVNSIAHSLGHASKLVLPVIPNPAPGIPAAYPECGSLRGEPCRPIVGSGAVTNMHADGHGHHATVTWKTPAVRPGTTLLGYVMYDNGQPLFLQPPASTSVFINHLAFGRHTFTIAAYYAGMAHADATPSNTVRLPS